MRGLHILAAAIAACGLSGCMVGPDYVAPTAPDAAGYAAIAPVTAGPHQSFVAGGDVAGRWWTAFRSKELDDLVDEALADNPNLVAAQAHLDAARESALAEEGALFPQIGLDNKDSYQKAPNGGLQSPLNNQKRYTYALFTPRLTVSYSPDVFGGVARRIESAQALAEAQQFQLEAAYLTLTSNVVLAAIQEASLRAQLAATEKVIDSQSKILVLLRKEVALGQVAQADVVQQEAAVATSRQLLVPLERQIAIQRNALAALAGRLPSETVRARFTLASLHLPARLPLSLPSVLVEQRPDVRAAAALVHQASADVGVAVANRLPNFAISGDVGQSAITLSRIANSGANFYSIAGTLSQPLFDAGTLYHRQRAAEASLEEAEARHKAVVLAAFQNVADTLGVLQSDAKAVAAAEAAERANFKSLDLMQKERVAGAANNLQILIAQQAYLNALVAAAQARAAQYADTAALFQALGGGWWNRTDAKSLKPGGDFFKFL